MAAVRGGPFGSDYGAGALPLLVALVADRCHPAHLSALRYL